MSSSLKIYPITKEYFSEFGDCITIIPEYNEGDPYLEKDFYHDIKKPILVLGTSPARLLKELVEFSYLEDKDTLYRILTKEELLDSLRLSSNKADSIISIWLHGYIDTIFEDTSEYYYLTYYN